MTAELELAAKKARTEGPKSWFSDRDLNGVQLPHNDHVVLTLKLKNFFVQRVLVDPGSLSEILYYDYSKKIGLKDEDLLVAGIPLVGFSSKLVYHKAESPSESKSKTPPCKPTSWWSTYHPHTM